MKNIYTALICAAVLSTVFTGCEDKKPAPAEPPKPEVYPAEGNAYMKDPAFRAKLDESVKVRNVILTERMKLQEREKALLAKYNGDRAAAEKDPEWAKLAVELKISDQKLADRQKAAEDLARNRILQAAADSKRIAAGEAVPKK